MAKNPIYRGNTINNFGRHLPAPFIEKIEIHDQISLTTPGTLLTMGEPAGGESSIEYTKLRIYASLLFHTDEQFPVAKYAEDLLKDLYITAIVTDQNNLMDSLMRSRQNLKYVIHEIYYIDQYDTLNQMYADHLGAGSMNSVQELIALDLNPLENTKVTKMLSNAVYVTQASWNNLELGPGLIHTTTTSATHTGTNLVFTSEYDEENNKVMKSSCIFIDIPITPKLSSIDDLGIFIGLSMANPGDLYLKHESIMMALSYGDLSFERIKQSGRLANRDRVGYFTQDDEFYNGSTLVSLQGRHYTTENVTHADIYEQMENLSTEFQDFSIQDSDLKTVIDNIAFIAQEYGNGPNYLLELNAYRKNIMNQDVTTPAGRFHRAYAAYISNANAALINDETQVFKRIVTTSKIRDYRPSQYMESLEPTYTPAIADYEINYPIMLHTNLSKFISARSNLTGYDYDGDGDPDPVFVPEVAYTAEEAYNTYRRAIQSILQRFEAEYTNSTVRMRELTDTAYGDAGTEISLGMDNVHQWLAAQYDLYGFDTGDSTHFGEHNTEQFKLKLFDYNYFYGGMYDAEHDSQIYYGEAQFGTLYSVATRFAMAVSMFQQWASGVNVEFGGTNPGGTATGYGAYDGSEYVSMDTDDVSNKVYLGGFAKNSGYFAQDRDLWGQNWNANHLDAAAEQYYMITDGVVWEGTENTLLYGYHNLKAFMSGYKLFGYHGNPQGGACTLEFGADTGYFSSGGSWNCENKNRIDSENEDHIILGDSVLEEGADSNGFVASYGTGVAAGGKLKKSYKCFNQLRPFYNVVGTGGFKEEDYENLNFSATDVQAFGFLLGDEYIGREFQFQNASVGVRDVELSEEAPPPAREATRFGHYYRVRDYRTAGTRTSSTGMPQVTNQSYDWSLRDPKWFYLKFVNMFLVDEYLQPRGSALLTDAEAAVEGEYAPSDINLSPTGENDYVDPLGYRSTTGGGNLFSAMQAIVNQVFGEWLYAGDLAGEYDSTGAAHKDGSFFLKMLADAEDFYDLCSEHSLIRGPPPPEDPDRPGEGELHETRVREYAQEFADHFRTTLIATIETWLTASPDKAKTYRLRWCPDYFYANNDVEHDLGDNSTKYKWFDTNMGSVNPYGGHWPALSDTVTKRNPMGTAYSEVYNTYPGNAAAGTRLAGKNHYIDDPFYYGGAFGRDAKFIFQSGGGILNYLNLQSDGTVTSRAVGPTPDDGDGRPGSENVKPLGERWFSDTMNYTVNEGDGVYPGRYVFNFGSFMAKKILQAFDDHWRDDVVDAVKDIIPLIYEYHGMPNISAAEHAKLAEVDVVTQKYGYFFVDIEKYIMYQSHVSRVINPHTLESVFTYGRDMVNRCIKLRRIDFCRHNAVRGDATGVVEYEGDYYIGDTVVNVAAVPEQYTPVKMTLIREHGLDAQPTDHIGMWFRSTAKSTTVPSVGYAYIPQLNVTSWSDFSVSRQDDPDYYELGEATREYGTDIIPDDGYSAESGYTGAGTAAPSSDGESTSPSVEIPGKESYNQWSYLMQRNYDFAGSIQIPNNYRLACFAYNYYVDDDIARQYHDSNFVQTQFIDKSHLIIYFIRDYAIEMYEKFQQYATWASENCSFNRFDSTFNQFFADSVEEIYAPEGLHRAPWFMGPVCVTIMEDLLTGKYGGEYHVSLEAAMYLSDTVNPYTGTLDGIIALETKFSELMDVLDNTWSKLVDDLDLTVGDEGIVIPSEHKFSRYRIGADPEINTDMVIHTPYPVYAGLYTTAGVIDYAGTPGDSWPDLPDPLEASQPSSYADRYFMLE
jgi:hypothetical protein